MKTRKWVGFYFTVLLCISMFFCTQASKQFGAPISNRAITKMSLQTLTEQREKYYEADEILTVQGQVSQIAPDGTWFFIKEGEYDLLIDVADAGFTVADIEGKTVLVQGAVYMHHFQAKLNATGVEIIE